MPTHAADATESGKPTRWPNYYEGDFVIRNYVFRSGETLPELKLHYRTLGTAKRNAAGQDYQRRAAAGQHRHRCQLVAPEPSKELVHL